MMFGTLLILIFVNFSVGFHIKDGETYQGFTVFDDKQGNYLRIKGPTYFKVDYVNVTRPPYNFSSTVKLSFDVTPSIFIYNLFLSGSVKYNNKPFWTYDGITDHCVEGKPGFTCPIKKNKKEVLQGEYNVLETGLIPGHYTLAVDATTELPGGKRLHLLGIEAGVFINAN